MTMKRTNQNGFTVLEVLVVLLVLAGIATAGWYVWSRQSAANAGTDTDVASRKSSEKTYQAKIGKFSFSYPASWKVKAPDPAEDQPKEGVDIVSPDYGEVNNGQNAGIKGVVISYLFLPKQPDGQKLVDEFSDYYGCGTQSRCPSYKIHKVVPVQVGGPYKTLYIVQVSEQSPGYQQVHNHIYFYRPADMRLLPKVGDVAYKDKALSFLTKTPENDGINITVTLPDSTLENAGGIFASDDAGTVMDIFRSFKAE